MAEARRQHASSRSEVLALTQDMTISRDEFLRGLPAAVGHAAFTVDANEIRAAGAPPSWRIELAALPDLRLGRLALPRQRISIYLTAFGALEARRFLERFELHFRRAGG